MATVRHFFPGGNTSLGFFSYYDSIISTSARRIFILKGGPGTGKSTFMKNVASAAVSRGLNVEFHHCSSDNNSLDGLVIPDIQIAFIDGTAPHIVDPKNPGCVDEIIHLGDFWDEEKMIGSKEQILVCNASIRSSFLRAYRMLQAAKSIYDDWESANFEALEVSEANRLTDQVIKKLFSGIDRVGAGRVRKLFASAITPDGPVNYLDSVLGVVSRRFVVFGEPGTGKSTLIQTVLNAAVTKGLQAEAFYCPLDPHKVEHLVLPEIDVAITTSSKPHTTTTTGAEMLVDMDTCLNYNTRARFAPVIKYDRETFWQLFDKAVSFIQNAKQLHDRLETYYVPNMRFTAVQELCNQTIERVIKYMQ